MRSVCHQRRKVSDRHHYKITDVQHNRDINVTTKLKQIYVYEQIKQTFRFSLLFTFAPDDGSRSTSPVQLQPTQLLSHILPAALLSPDGAARFRDASGALSFEPPASQSSAQQQQQQQQELLQQLQYIQRQYLMQQTMGLQGKRTESGWLAIGR